MVSEISLWVTERSICTAEVATYRTTEKIHDMVLTEGKLKVRKIMETIRLSRVSDVYISYNPQDGYHVCSYSLSNGILWQLRSSVWRCSVAIRTSFLHRFIVQRNMDSVQYTRVQTALEIVYFSVRIGAGEDSGGSDSHQRQMIVFLIARGIIHIMDDFQKNGTHLAKKMQRCA